MSESALDPGPTPVSPEPQTCLPFVPVIGSYCPQPSPSRRLGQEKEGRGSNVETTVPELGRGRVFAPDFEKQGLQEG